MQEGQIQTQTGQINKESLSEAQESWIHGLLSLVWPGASVAPVLAALEEPPPGGKNTGMVGCVLADSGRKGGKGEEIREMKSQAQEKLRYDWRLTVGWGIICSAVMSCFVQESFPLLIYMDHKWLEP